MKALVIGVGAVGARAARQLLSSDSVDEVLLCDPARPHVEAVAASLGRRSRVVESADDERADVALLALPGGRHRAEAERQLERGAQVVSVSDAMSDVK
ncbi:MAG: Gfo/Idh/MocA family oxidoreductase, partial [Actinomycetota bacterium]